MKTTLGVMLMAIVLQICQGLAMAATKEDRFVAVNDVTWKTLGKDENDSMPIGNGDLAANVWTEQNGDLVLLVAKSDAWSEMGKLLKLGRVRIHIAPNPFADSAQFTQTLHLEDGSIEIQSGKNVIHVWADANRPVIHMQAELDRPAVVDAKLEVWRTKTHPYNEPSPDKGGLFEFGNHQVPLDFEADTVMPSHDGQITWYHYNAASLYPLLLEQEHMQPVADKYPDPLLHRCFGAALTGTGMIAADDGTLRSAEPTQTIGLDVVALTQTQVPSPASWKTSLDSLASADRTVPYAAALAAHRQWWREFWQRSWIHVEGSDDAAKVSQGYIMQRYMVAVSSRGGYPAKFNGGLFTVGHDMPDDRVSTNANHNQDFAIDEPGSPQRQHLRRSIDSTRDDLRTLREIVDHSPYPKAEIQLTEWNSSPSPVDHSHDALAAAAFVVKTNIESIGLVDSLSYWTFTDVFEENRKTDSVFHGGFGLINYQEIPKAAFHGYRMMNALGDRTIAQTTGAIVTNDTRTHRIAALIYNYPPEVKVSLPVSRTLADADAIDATGSPRDLVLHVDHLPPSASFLIETLDRTHGNAISAWEEMGKPEPPTREQTQALLKAAKGTQKEIVKANSNGVLEIKRPVAAWSVVLVIEQARGNKQ